MSSHSAFGFNSSFLSSLSLAQGHTSDPWSAQLTLPAPWPRCRPLSSPASLCSPLSEASRLHLCPTTLTPLPSSLVPALPLWVLLALVSFNLVPVLSFPKKFLVINQSLCCCRSWYWISLRLPDHRLCQEPLPQAAAFLLRHSWFCLVWGYGTVLSYDGFPSSVRFLSRLVHVHIIPYSTFFFMGRE